MRFLGFLVVLATVASLSHGDDEPTIELDISGSAHLEVKYNMVNQAIRRVLKKQDSSLKYHPFHKMMEKIHKAAPKYGFSYTDCGDSDTELITISGLDVQPDPIEIPGTVTVSGTFTVKEDLNAPIKVVVLAYSQLFGTWYKIPCVDGVGSCTYDDICEDLEDMDCPSEITDKGYDCSCPIKAGEYKLDNMEFNIDTDISLSGKYKIQLELTTGDTSIGCAEFVADLA